MNNEQNDRRIVNRTIVTIQRSEISCDINPVVALHEILTIRRLEYIINFFSAQRRTNVNSNPRYISARGIEERIQCPPSSASVDNWSSFERCNLGTRWKLKVVDTARAISAHLRHSLDFGRRAPGGSFSFRFTTFTIPKLLRLNFLLLFFLFTSLSKISHPNIPFEIIPISHEDDELGPLFLSFPI